jgi:hypothetical protein
MLDEVEDERRRELVSLRKQLLPQTVSLLHSLLHNTGELHCFPRLSHAPLLFLHNTCELLCCPRLSPFSTPSILHFKYLSIERNLMAVDGPALPSKMKKVCCLFQGSTRNAWPWPTWWPVTSISCSLPTTSSSSGTCSRNSGSREKLQKRRRTSVRVSFNVGPDPASVVQNRPDLASDLTLKPVRAH